MNDIKRFLWSPYGGRFVSWRGKYYWSDGDVCEAGPCAVGLNDPAHNEDFSAWSEWKRAAVKARFAAERAAEKKRQDEYNTDLKSRHDAACAKLTKDEYDAICCYVRD